MSSRYLIYALVDPRSGQWRYIGKSAQGLERPREHGRPSVLRAEGNLHKKHWIEQLVALDLSYEIEVLEELPDGSRLSDAEMDWIAAARAAGVQLTNKTDGGDGKVGFHPSDETKRKISEAQKGRTQSAEQRLKSGAALRGRRFSANHRAAIADSLRGRSRPADVKLKVSRTKGGRPVLDVCCGVMFELRSELANSLSVRPATVANALRLGHKVRGHQLRLA